MEGTSLIEIPVTDLITPGTSGLVPGGSVGVGSSAEHNKARFYAFYMHYR